MSQPLDWGPDPAQDADILDVVCSQMLSLDRRLPRTLAQWAQRFFLSMSICYGLLIVFLTLLWLANVLFNPTIVSRLVVYFFLFAFGAFPFLLLLLSGERGLMKFPSNLRLNKEGLRLLWIERNLQSHLIPWAAIAHAGVRDNYLDLVINTNYSEASWYDLFFETAAIWRRPSPIAPLRGKFNPAYIHVAFPLDSLTLDADKQKLIMAISERANKNIIDKSLALSDFGVEHGTGYTQLWLDDLHSGRDRTRSEDLIAGSFLQGERFKIDKIIGSGGQAKIYRAKDKTSDRLVVLKEIVLPMHAGVEQRQKAFDSARKEADLLQRLNHPGIVKLLDHFVEDHRAYLVLENIDGLTLRRIVAEKGPFDENIAKNMARSIAEILQYLHSQTPPVVHRDLSPDNLLLDADGQIKLIDFSVAHESPTTGGHTVVGRSNYIAPEQFKGKPLPQSDLYSLGATIYFLLTASDPVPISTSSPADKLGRLTALDIVITKLTDMDWGKRYQDASALLRDLA